VAAIKKHRHQPALTVIEGSCVSTWLMWLHMAPVEDMMVLSEIGEQWSPQTAPVANDIPMLFTLFYMS
jgi:hypothetical protein